MSAPALWQDVRLGNLAHIYSGGTPSRSVASYWGGEVPWVSTAEIDSTLITSTKETITELGLRNSAAKIAPAGTLVMALYGQGKTRGRVSILGVDAAMNQACAAISPHVGVNPQFLLAYLRHNYAMIRALSNSGGQENLSGEIVKSIPVALPDLSRQKQIAEASQDADLLVDYLKRAIAKKQAVKQGMMQQFLSGRVRLAGFREAWAPIRFCELVDDLQAGVSVRSLAGPRRGSSVLKTSSIDRGRFNPGEAKPILGVDLGRARLHPVADSLIISRMNTPALVGDVGYVAEGHPDLYLPDRLWLARRRNSTATDMRWLAYFLASEVGTRLLKGLATGTSGSMKNIPKSRLLGQEIVAPGELEQQRISAVLADVDAEIDTLTQKSIKTRAIKRGMMQQLLTGRTRLPRDAVS